MRWIHSSELEQLGLHRMCETGPVWHDCEPKIRLEFILAVDCSTRRRSAHHITYIILCEMEILLISKKYSVSRWTGERQRQWESLQHSFQLNWFKRRIKTDSNLAFAMLQSSRVDLLTCFFLVVSRVEPNVITKNWCDCIWNLRFTKPIFHITRHSERYTPLTVL